VEGQQSQPECLLYCKIAASIVVSFRCSDAATTAVYERVACRWLVMDEPTFLQFWYTQQRQQETMHPPTDQYSELRLQTNK